MIYFVPLLALVAPFFLWPIEQVFPHPHVVEEVAKGLMVFLLLKKRRSFTTGLKVVILASFLFTFSETAFYLSNIFLVGSLSIVFLRLTITLPMHLLTFLIIYTFAYKRKYFLPLGVLIAIFVHYLFNVWVATV